MSMVRTDRAESPLSPPVRMPDGRVVYEGVIARPGIYVYDEGGKAVRELVPAEVLSDPAWLAELAGASLVVEHPVEGAVDGSNFRALAVGTNLDARIGPQGTVIGRLSVVANEGHAAIADGKYGLSPRYHADMDETPGVDPVYGPYDRRQTRRYQVDQVALTDSPRGGGTTTIRRDSTAVGDQMDPKAVLAAALVGVGVPEDKVPALMAAIEEAVGAPPEMAEGKAEVEMDADPMAKLEARVAKLEACGVLPKADSDLMKRLAAVEAKVAKYAKADSERNAKADSEALTIAAAKLGHKIDGATWLSLAVAEGAAPAGLTVEAARAVVQTAVTRADARLTIPAKVEPITADAYNHAL